jgi:hypothetical protein
MRRQHDHRGHVQPAVIESFEDRREATSRARGPDSFECGLLTEMELVQAVGQHRIEAFARY